MAERATGCPTCHGAGWLCDLHQQQPFPHGDCHGPGNPCPDCQIPGRRPRPPHGPGDVSFASRPDDGLPFYAPNHRPPSPPTPQPGRHVWTLMKDGQRLDCEIRTHRSPDFSGYETQTLYNGTLLSGRMFPSAALADQWAAEEQRAARADGWT